MNSWLKRNQYPNCPEIDSDVYISGEDIVRLSGLKSLLDINGDLEITDNDGLKSFRGFTAYRS